MITWARSRADGPSELFQDVENGARQETFRHSAASDAGLHRVQVQRIGDGLLVGVRRGAGGLGDRVVRGRDAPGPVVDLLADIGDESTVAAGSLAPFLAVNSTTFSTVV